MEKLGQISAVLLISATMLLAGIPTCACANCSHQRSSEPLAHSCNCCGGKRSEDSAGCCCKQKADAAASARGCTCCEQAPDSPAPLPGTGSLQSLQLAAAMPSSEVVDLEALLLPSGRDLDISSRSLLPSDRRIALKHFLL